MDDPKKQLMWKIINVFENDDQSPNRNYSTIYIYPDGPNEVRQLTLGAGITEYGNLQKLIQIYINDSGALASEFSNYVSKIGKTPLVNDKAFRVLLVRASKEDQIFRTAEDKILEDRYYKPALKFFEAGGFSRPLSLAVILDSFVHSGSIPDFLRSRFPAKLPSKGGSENEWNSQYLNVRRSWLAGHSRKILRGTVYRPDFFISLMNKKNYDLDLPFSVNGVKLS